MSPSTAQGPVVRATPNLRFLAFLFLFLAIVVLAPAAFAQRQPVTVTSTVSRDDERRTFAVTLARAINTAEVAYKKNHDGYATWDNLQSNGDFSSNGTKWAGDSATLTHTLYGPGPEVVPGWKLRLVVSADGKHYDLLLEDTNDPKCLFAVVSDERGQLRQAKSLSCAL
jgi:hypothetical protein